jgi:hypothetical protein
VRGNQAVCSRRRGPCWFLGVRSSLWPPPLLSLVVSRLDARRLRCPRSQAETTRSLMTPMPSATGCGSISGPRSFGPTTSLNPATRSTGTSHPASASSGKVESLTFCGSPTKQRRKSSKNSTSRLCKRRRIILSMGQRRATVFHTRSRRSRRVSMPRPDDFKFPHQGWLKVSQEVVAAWPGLSVDS